MCVRLKASYLSALAHAEHSINPTSNFKSHCSYYNEHCEAVTDLGIAYPARAGDFCMNQTLNWHYFKHFLQIWPTIQNRRKIGQLVGFGKLPTFQPEPDSGTVRPNADDHSLENTVHITRAENFTNS